MNIKSCTLCPRQCGVDRTAGEHGFCGASDKAVIGLYYLHRWEEPCISGTNGSGTVFFSHCTMKCVFCQNYAISTENRGRIVTQNELCDIFIELQSMGAHNINLVTPTHYLFEIIPALKKAKAKGLNIPIVYNTSGYEDVKTLKELDGIIDVYMPDFKYWRSRYAAEYSAAPDYPEVVKSALAEMVAQTGKPSFENGIMTRGTIVRHLILPGLLYDAKKILDYLFTTYGDDIYISIMSQYTPLPHVLHIPALNRKIGEKEYEIICDYAAKIGISNAFIQEGEAAQESFIPKFYS